MCNDSQLKITIVSNKPFAQALKSFQKAKCGHNLTFNMTNEKVFVKPCWFIDAFGNKCGNQGISVDILEKLLLDEIKKYNDTYLILFDSEDAEKLRICCINSGKGKHAAKASKGFRAC